MRRPRRAAACVLLATLLSGAPAEALDDLEQQARRHYTDGARHFNAGELDLAIASFKRSYELKPTPVLLFNIAQVYRAGRDRERAVYYYEAYLREAPNGSESGFAEARLAELRVEKDVLAKEPKDPGASLRTAGLWTAGGGLACVAVGFAFGVYAHTALGDGQTDAAGRAQTQALVLTGLGAGALAAGGLMYYVGSRERPVLVQASAGATGAQVAVTVGF